MSFLCGCFGDVQHHHSHHHISNKIHTSSIKDRTGGNKLWESKVQVSKQKNIIVIGPEGSGKTTLVHQLIEKKITLPSSSTLVAQHKIILNDYPMVIFDVPGNTTTSVRDGLMSSLFAVIFVVDWSDELRRCLAVENLANLFFSNENVRSVPMLIVINKVDHAPVVAPYGNTPSSSSSSFNFKATPTRPPSAEQAAETLRLGAVVPHSHMSVLCASSYLGWGIQEIMLWISDICTTELNHHHHQHAASSNMQHSFSW